MRESWKDLWEFEADLKCPRDKIYYWPYAGGRCGYALLNGWDVADKSFVKLHEGTEKQYQAWREKLGLDVEVCDMDFCGLNALGRKHGLRRTEIPPSFQLKVYHSNWTRELYKFAKIPEEGEVPMQVESSTGSVSRNRVILMAQLLSGPLAQDYAESGFDHSRRRAALIGQMNCTGVRGNLGDFAAKAAESFCVNTAVNQFKMRFNSPVYFPETGDKPSVLDNAWISLKGKKKRVPPVYADTSVVLNARILSGKEIEKFLCSNPWCTTVLLGSRKISFEGLITVDAAKLEIDDLGWDMEALAQMSKSFVRWLGTMSPKKRRKMVKKLANNAGRLIDAYDERHTAIPAADRYYWRLMLTAILALTDFLEAENKVDGVSYPYLRAVLLNLLLPGCCPIPSEGAPLEGPRILMEADYPELFRKAMIDMLSETERFLYVPRGKDKNLCPEYAEDDESFQYYGYRRLLKKEYPAIFFVREEFLKQFARFLPDGCDARAVLEFCENQAALEYFAQQGEGSRKARIPRKPGDTRVVPSVILMLDKLDFLPEELQEKLLQPFTDKKNPPM